MTTNKEINFKMQAFLQVILMIFLSGMTQIISLIKSSLMATKFGTSSKIDAYNVILNITFFLFSFVASGITTVLIPAFSRKVNKISINTFLVTIYFYTLIISCVFIYLQNPIFSYFSNGSDRFINMAKDIFLVLLISQFFNTYMGVTTAFFQCINKYNIPKILTLVTSIMLVVLLYINKKATVQYLTIITGITTILNATFQRGISYKYGMGITFKLNFNDPEYKKMMLTYLPTIFSVGLYQVNLLMDSLLSSKTGVGNVTILTYSNSLIGMVNSLVITNLLMYIYPKISLVVDDNIKEAKRILFKSISLLSFFVCIMIITFFSIGKIFLKLLMLHGKFDISSLNILYLCTSLYIVSLPFNVIRDLIYRFFYAITDTKTTLVNSIIASLINFIFSILLSMVIGIYGVIIGTLISSILSMIMILRKYSLIIGWNEKRIKYIKEFVLVFLPMIIILLMIAVINLYVKNNIVSSILITIISISLYIISVLIGKGEVFKYLKNMI